MDRKYLIPLLSLVGGALIALGFATPGNRISAAEHGIGAVKDAVKVVEGRLSDHDIQFAETRKDIGYIMDGIDDLRGLGSEERRALRRSRRRGVGPTP